MSATQLEKIFPQLKRTGYAITSPFDDSYNCIAFAAEDLDLKWWWPSESTDAYWPPEIPRETTLEAFMAAFETLNYKPCRSADHEPNFQKIAIYADNAGTPTHAARQLDDGSWTSKLGNLEDIRHTHLAAIEDAPRSPPMYGKIAAIMRRPTLK